jgi:F-type H+-transporting ATPase subunit a
VQLAALEFPPIGHLLEWEDLGAGFNKVALIFVLALAVTILLFTIAGRQAALVPRGVQNLVEASIDFVRDGIVMQTIGPDGMTFMPLLLALFWFIFLTNITEIVPFIQFPANARMAMPFFLAVMTWAIFNIVGVVKQGLFGYLKSSLFPPGVPKALYALVTPIELISTFLVRPFSLAVRLFANMLAGHLLLVTFAVLTAALWTSDPFWLPGVLPFSFLMLVFLTGFEILVSVLQAYIFTILAAVYIGGAMHPEH